MDVKGGVHNLRKLEEVGISCVGSTASKDTLQKVGEFSKSQGRDHTVTPKLMSTLRLVSQDCADTSLTLGTNTELLTGLVSVGKVSIVPGLNIEATRLLSSVLRYSRHPEVSQLMLELGALPLLLGLLNSPHSQLINEMLVALNLMTAARPPRQEVVENIEPELLSNKA